MRARIHYGTLYKYQSRTVFQFHAFKARLRNARHAACFKPRKGTRQTVIGILFASYTRKTKAFS